MKKTFLLTIALILFSVQLVYSVEDKVIAIINNEAITKAELDTYVNVIKMQIGYDGWRQFEMSEQKALDSLIEDKLILQEAKRKNIEVSDRLIEARVEEVRRRLGTEEEFSNFLASQGFSLNELKKRFKENMLSEKLVNIEVRSRIFISPKEVTEFYQSHIEEFSMPERVRLESIFVKSKDAADNIYQKLKEGADFIELQKKYSEKSSVGIVNRGQLIKDADSIVFRLNIDEFSTPLETSGGYYIFLVKEKIASSQTKLVEVQDKIRSVLMDIKFKEKLKELINKLKANSYIVIKDGQ